MEISPRSHKCNICTKNRIFEKSNNLTPEPAPQCLKDLNQIELAAIALICPIIQIFTRGSSKATRGHCLTVVQDVKSFAKKLPKLPRDLPFILLKNPRESVQDEFFKVRRSKIMTALQWLKVNNTYWRDVVISEDNAREYPDNGILQTLTQADPDVYKIPGERPSADNEESAAEAASTIDLPPRHQDAIDMFRKGLEHDPEEQDPKRGLQNLHAADRDKSLNLSDAQSQEAEQIAWPKRGQRANEFEEGFFARCYPDLFPRNIDREGEDGVVHVRSLYRRETGDITEFRQGKNPSLAEWFKHLLR